MDLEQMQGMQPALYHRYNVVDEGDEEEDDDDGDYKSTAFSAHLITQAISGMDLNDGPVPSCWEDNITEDIDHDAAEQQGS